MEVTNSMSLTRVTPKAFAIGERHIVVILAILAFLLSGSPKLHISVGAPLYAVDIIVLYLFMKSKRKAHFRHRSYAKTIVHLLGAYLLFVILGELRGGFVYGRPLDSIYILCRSCLAVSIAYIVPRQVQTLSDLRILLKGILLGLLLSAAIAVLYSIPQTRGIADGIFSIKTLTPNSDQLAGVANSYYDDVFEGSYRGRTLLGASTFSSGVMAALWPLIFMCSALLPDKGFWKYASKAGLCLLPLGILATYGRSAWLSVILVTASSLLWGSVRGRIKLLFGILISGLLIASLGAGAITENLPLVNRVVDKTQVTIEYGAEKESEAERFLAYVEPFEHVTKYPSFLLAGSGVAQRRWGGNAYGEALSASHAIPGMSYYAYGVGGAICQIGFMLLSFRLISRRLQQASQHLRVMTWIWRSLLACWFGLLPWWCFGHGIVTAPRGAMVFFLFLGTVLACDQIFTVLCAQADSKSL